MNRNMPLSLLRPEEAAVAARVRESLMSFKTEFAVDGRCATQHGQLASDDSSAWYFLTVRRGGGEKSLRFLTREARTSSSPTRCSNLTANPWREFFADCSPPTGPLPQYGEKSQYISLDSTSEELL